MNNLERAIRSARTQEEVERAKVMWPVLVQRTTADLFCLGDENIDPALNGKRYPAIESIRVICQRGTPSATIKVRRRQSTTGGPAVVRIYYVYSRKHVCRWLRAQAALATGEPFRFTKS